MDWSSRLGRHPGIPPTTAYLLRQQTGQCPHCGLSFTTADLLERDHIIPVAQGGRRHRDNTHILHAQCHDVKTANDRAGCISDKDEIGEEPSRRKRLRSVLQDQSGKRFPDCVQQKPLTLAQRGL